MIELDPISKLCRSTYVTNNFDTFYNKTAALSCPMVSVLATGPTVAGSGPAEDGGFLWVIKNPQRALYSEGK
jgi:hypothetical protein